jgi:hypothetical protein
VLEVGLKIFTAMKIYVMVVWVMTPCSDAVGYHYHPFRGSCCLHLEGEVC